MKNKALISLSFLVLFGVSACSTSSQKTPATSTGNSTQLGAASSSSIRPTNGGSTSYGTKQRQSTVADQNEQKRLAYNYAWQKKQQQSRNKIPTAITDAQARRAWQQKQTQLLNQERGRASQQKRSSQQQRFAHQQKILAKEYAAQQRRAKYNAANKMLSPAQKYAAQQMKRQAQQNARNQGQSPAQQYATQQMQKPKQTQQYALQRQTFQYKAPQQRQAVQYAALQQPRQAQQYALQQRNTQQQALQQRNTQQYATQQRQNQQRAQQQNQQTQYLALLQPQPNRTPRTPPQSNIGGLSSSEIRTIGDKIFRNESGGEIDKLVHWNVGENFASMGIGHFTWYPSGRRTRFGNTFPGLLDHLQSNGVQLPTWVQKAKFSGAPWRTKGELLQAKQSPQLRQFQNLLYETRYLQAGYIVGRAKRAMPRLVKATPPHLKAHVAQNLNAVANTPGGWYALIDYVNFKGEGLNRKGGYKGQNWGLLQVLENMRPSQPGQMALNNFADSAIQTLERRIRNSNPSRGESRWMRGWAVRCNTYRQPFVI